jgi:molecular chaperone GrpE
VRDEADAAEQRDPVLEDRPRQDDAGDSPSTEPDPRVEGEDTTPADDTVALLEERLRRALADLDNLRKRYVREVERERLTERMQVARQWLPVVDDLERALEHLDKDVDHDPRAVIEGVRVIRDRALAVLAQLGFPRFDATGEPFDPARHEAVGVIDSEAAAGTVAATIRPGYGDGRVVLRPAEVVVARAPLAKDRGADTQGPG